MMPPQAGSASVPPPIVALPIAVISPTLTEPEIVRRESAASTTLLLSIQGVGVPSARCHVPVVQSPLPDQ